MKLAQPLADALGVAPVVVLEDAGHVCNLEQPEASTGRSPTSSPPTRLLVTNERWSGSAGAPVTGAPAVSNGRVCLGTEAVMVAFGL